VSEQRDSGAPGEFLADAQNPALTSAEMARMADPDKPDRLAWNTFRTLALWETDIWVPRVLDIGLGAPNPISDREWSGASVQLWATGLDLDRGTDVLLDGPEALVIAVAYVDAVPPSGEVRGAMAKVVSDASLGGRQAGFLAVVPTRDDETQLQSVLEQAASGDELDALTEAVGWVTWRELGELALDLAEESDPLRDDQVHLLVTELQRRFPDIEL
jgi:hypothetical protein